MFFLRRGPAPPRRARGPPKRSAACRAASRHRTSLSTSDLAIGVAKSFIFGFVIAIIASDEGLGVDRRVAAIGEAASRAVVYCLLGVLATDTLFNAVFYFIPALVL